MSKSTKIDGELVISSGEKLKKIGFLMITQVILFILYYLIVSNNSDYETIQGMSVLMGFISIGIWIAIVSNFIESGNGFIRSIQIIIEDGEHKEYYPNGKLKEIGIHKDGKRVGMWESYYQNGQLKESVRYKDEKKEGLYESYYENGQLNEKGMYENGEMNGHFESYHENGEIHSPLTGLFRNNSKIKK